MVFVAVKPHLVPLVLNEISPHVTDRHIIVSIAAGVTLATIEEVSAQSSRVMVYELNGDLKMSNVLFLFFNPKFLPENAVAIRMMPNLPCLAQEGALLFTLGAHAKQEDGALLRSLLHRCGLVEEGPEAWIDIHTGLSGSGVAFVSVPGLYDVVWFAGSLCNGLETFIIRLNNVDC